MSLAALPSKVIYTGDGVTTAFPITMPLPAGSTGSDLYLTIFDTLGNSYQITTNFTIDLSGLKINYPTVGSVYPLGAGVNALPVSWQLVIARVEPLSQLLSVASQGSFTSTAIQQALDLITMILQQLQEQINRAVLVGINTPSPASPVIAPNASGLAIVNGTYAALKALAALNPTVQMWGFATDQGVAGQLYFYCGNTAVGDQGWFGPLAGG